MSIHYCGISSELETYTLYITRQNVFFRDVHAPVHGMLGHQLVRVAAMGFVLGLYLLLCEVGST